MGAFTDKNGVFDYNGYTVRYNNERVMFKDNSAKNLFSFSTYLPRGTNDVYNKPYENYQVIPNYIDNGAYLFFNLKNSDWMLRPVFPDGIKNMAYAFSYCGSTPFSAFNPNNDWHGPSFPDSIEDATGMFKCSSYSGGVPTNFYRNMPNNLISLNNTFFHCASMNYAYYPERDANNNFILDKYDNLFNIWAKTGYLGAQSSNWTYYGGSNYYNAENGWDDRRFVNSTIPDGVKYMNGTFALSSIGIDNYMLASGNNIEFHLPNNLKDASFCFFNTSYLNNFRFTLPDSLTEANYMFASSYGYNSPNRLIFGNGLVNAVGMFAQLYYGYCYVNNTTFPQEELPNTIKNAHKMFLGTNLFKVFNIPRSVEDASFMFSSGGQYDKRNDAWNNITYVIPNTVKNIDFLFANVSVSPNNYITGNTLPNQLDILNPQSTNFNPQQHYFSSTQSYFGNTTIEFEEGSNLNSVRGMLFGWTMNTPMEIPNSVNDISFLYYASGTNYTYANIDFSKILKENVTNAAWAFGYGYLNPAETLEIEIPAGLKDMRGMFMNMYFQNSADPNRKMFEFVNLENSQVENASWLFNGCYNFNQRIDFPSTITDLSRTFFACGNFVGHYDDWNFNLERFPNLQKCDYIFASCGNYNIPTSFPNSLTSLEGVFQYCTNYNQPTTIPEGVLSATNLFQSCVNFDQYVALPSSLVTIDRIFDNCPNFNYGGQDLDFGHLTNVKSMEFMFNNCSNLNKVINEQSFVWPPHVEQISGVFNNCPKIDIETFVIPGSVKTGSNILRGTTISNGIYIQEGYECLTNPFVNIKGKDLGLDGNYYINSIIIECGNGSISLPSFTPTFYNTNVNNIIFRNGVLNFWAYNNFNGNSALYIANSNKFNGNIKFVNIEKMSDESGRISIRNCDNFNQPISYPPVVFTSSDKELIYHVILGNYNPSISMDLQPDDYLMILENTNNQNTWSPITFYYNFKENSTEFKSALNNLIDSPQDYFNILRNLNNYPSYWQQTTPPSYQIYFVDTCNNFNSSINFGYGTNILRNVIFNCRNFNTGIVIPDTATTVYRLVHNCPNFDQQLIIPGSVKNAASMISQCVNFNTSPIFSTGTEDISQFFLGLTRYNSRTYLPDTLLKANQLFGNCYLYNQKTDFFGAYDLWGALLNCYSYNSETNFSYTSESRIISRLFAYDNLFNKEVDFNCDTINNATSAFYNCVQFNSNVRNCNIIATVKNYFSDSVYQATTNSSFIQALANQGHNVFYYSSAWEAEEGINFYNYYTNISYKDASEMFYNCSQFNPEIIPDFSGVLRADRIFYNCRNFNRPVDFRNVNALNYGFYYAVNFNQPLVFNDTVYSLHNAFKGDSSLVPIPKFLNGINIARNAYYSSDQVMANGISAFEGCSNMGIGQEGFDYAITFEALNTGADGSLRIPESTWFFHGCSNLNVPLIFNSNNCYYPYFFLQDCMNFNSNIILAHRNDYRGYGVTQDYLNNLSTNLPYEVITDPYDENNLYIQFNYMLFYSLSSAGFFYNSHSYNRFFEVTDINNVSVPEFYFNVLSGANFDYLSWGHQAFFDHCDNFNYPIQRHFIPVNADYARFFSRYQNEIHIYPRTGWDSFVKNCPNFNQPILDYYFDSPESLALHMGMYFQLNLNLYNCCNFNQNIIGNFTVETNGMNMCFGSFDFYNCITPNDVRMNFFYKKGNPSDPDFPSYQSYEVSVKLRGLKTNKDSTHRNVYINLVGDSSLTTPVSLSYYLKEFIEGQTSDSVSIDTNVYENFVPENIFIDKSGMVNTSKVFSLANTNGVFSCCNYFPGFYQYNYSRQGVEIPNLQNNQTIKNLQFFPSVSVLNMMGAYQDANYRKPLLPSIILNYVDCGYIDIWNTFLGGRNVHYTNTNMLFYQLKNVNANFHFEPSTEVYFNNANSIFTFSDNCEVNIYINSFKSFNNVNNFVSKNYFNINNLGECNVNIFISGGLTYYNTKEFFNSYTPTSYDRSNNLSFYPNYYIEPGTIFYQCTSLPRVLKTPLNLSQFQGISSYNFSDTDYEFVGDLDLSAIQLNYYDPFLNAGFYNGNSLTIMPGQWYTSSYNSPIGTIKGCRNIVINRYYSGISYINNLCNSYYFLAYNQLKTNNFIDDTNTRMNLYVKSGTSLATYLKQNAIRAFNIFQNTYQASWDQNVYEVVTETSDRFTYVYHYQTGEDIYYNIVFY